MKKVLIITYYWPPASGPGVQRWLKFAKYLPEFGWQPIILTVKNGSFPAYDESLLKDIPETSEIFYSKTLEPFTLYNFLRGKKGTSVEPGMSSIKGKNKSLYQKIAAYIRANFFIPDARIGWLPYALKEVKNILKKHKIDIVITTSPPHSAQLIGAAIKEQYHLPWIADFRDPWVNMYINQILDLSSRVKQKNIQYENKVLRLADMVMVVGNSMHKEFTPRNSNTYVLYNGFDTKDLPSLEAKPSVNFVLEYVGKLSPVADTPILWKTIKELRNSYPNFKKHFRLSFTGMISEPIKQSIEKEKLSTITSFHPFIPHQEAIKKMIDANMLLLIIANTPENDRIITGKIFEYLATQTPILGIGPIEGDAAILLRQCERMPMVDFNDANGMKKALLTHFDHWLKHQNFSLKNTNNLHLKFSRKKITQKLVHLLDGLI